jgi:hypothetical protein
LKETAELHFLFFDGSIVAGTFLDCNLGGGVEFLGSEGAADVANYADVRENATTNIL